MDWALLMEIPSETEAEIVRGALEAVEIPCEIESLKFHAEPVNFGPMSRVRVHVPADRLEEARAVLAEITSEAAENSGDGEETGGAY